MIKKEPESGIVELRKLIAILDSNGENWTEGYSAEEILKILRAVRKSEYHLGPGHMNATQRTRAIQLGEAPKYCDYCDYPRDHGQHECERCGKYSPS